MKLFKLFIASIVVIGLTSCLGNTSNTITQEFTPYCISYVTDVNTGVSTVNTGTIYKVNNNMDEGTLTLEIGNLKLPNGTYVSLNIADQRYTFNESGAMVVRIPSYTSVVAGMSHTITNLNFEYYNRYMGQQSFPMVVLNYVIDDMYAARVIYSPAYYWGTTTVTDQNGNVFTNTAQTSFYGVQFFPDKNTAAFGAFSAKFAENMPALNMTFKDIPYTFSPNGYTLVKDELIPNIGETPYPAYKITNFSMSGTWGGNQYVSFVCTIDTEKLKGEFHVSASLAIMPSNNTSGN